MKLHEIKNLSAEALKENAGEHVEACKKCPADELAASFIAALTDAKLRDEKLAEQGRTITTLSDSLEQSKAVHRKDCEEAKASTLALRNESLKHADTIKRLQDTIESLASQLGVTKEALNIAEARATRHKALAMRNHQAVTAASKILSDANTAAQLDIADEG